MVEFIEKSNLLGIIIGLLTFIIIGLFHPLVIKIHYRLGTKSWVIFLIFGVVFIIFSLLIINIITSIIFAIIAFSSFWSILEIFHQEKRVQKGWFPANPNIKNNMNNIKNMNKTTEISNKIIETSNKSLSMLGIILIGIAIMLILNSILQISVTKDYLYNNLHLGSVGVLIGFIFLRLGKKKKYIIFYENEFSYKISKHTFTEKYNEINLIQTFIDTNNHSKNLMIYFDENKTLSFSSSFWSEEQLIEAYKEFISKSKEFIDKNEVSIENDLSW